MDSLKQTALKRIILTCIQKFQITVKFIYVMHILVKSNKVNQGKVVPVTTINAGGGEELYLH